MKICEYDYVCCPYCKEDRDKHLREFPKKSLRETGLGLHVIQCLKCHGIFFIPCED